jgi:hypothetical protein
VRNDKGELIQKVARQTIPLSEIGYLEVREVGKAPLLPPPVPVSRPQQAQQAQQTYLSENHQQKAQQKNSSKAPPGIAKGRGQQHIKTDGQITRAQLKEKNFTKWQGGSRDAFLKLDDYDDGIIIGDDSKKKGAAGKEVWDQFEAVKKLEGKECHFKDEDYTTVLNMSEISQELKAKASNIERELLQKSTQQPGLSRHILEDRGLLALREENEQQNGEGSDEEALYSAVLQSGRYKDAAGAPQKPEEEDKNASKNISFGKGPLRFTNSKKSSSSQQKSEANDDASQKGSQARPQQVINDALSNAGSESAISAVTTHSQNESEISVHSSAAHSASEAHAQQIASGNNSQVSQSSAGEKKRPRLKMTADSFDSARLAVSPAPALQPQQPQFTLQQSQSSLQPQP